MDALTTTGPVPTRAPAGRHGGVNTAQRLDAVSAELAAVADAVDEQAAALVARVDGLAAQLDRIEAAVQGQALVLGQAVPPLVDVTQIVGEAQRVGWRRAWRARRKAAR